SDVLIGAPRANTSSGSVVERGAVYSCPWKNSAACQTLDFDSSGDRTNTEGSQMEFKSKQWFGASVRSDGEHILACAPLYQWSTFGVSEREPVGTCYLKKADTVVEYSPCRSSANSPEGQGFCQAGFSVDFLKKNNRVVVGGPGSFYWQGQLISDDVSEIFTRFENKYITQYANTLATKLRDRRTSRGEGAGLREHLQRPEHGVCGELHGNTDVAISAPYGGADHSGLVYIHNGRPQGPDPSPSQVTPAELLTCHQCAVHDFRVDLLLDRLKQKEATKRVLFLHGQTFSYSKNMVVSNGRGPACEEQHVYLRDEFRDKITPISVAMEYRLDYQLAADRTGLLPIIDVSAHILLDCGDDNICKPDLKLSVESDRQQIYIGDDNALTLKISAENQGEGAYEAELHIYLPQQADFTGVGRGEALSRLSCAYKTENQTKMVVCDLGNPMKGGTKVLAELQFSVHQLSEEDTSVKFDLQIVSTSSPGQVLLPIANWKPKVPPQLLNSGPSTFSKASLEVKWPYQFKNGSLLYITSYETEGPINCTTDTEINPLNISNPLSSAKNNTIPPRERETEGRNRNHVRQRRDLESRDAQSDLQTLTENQNRSYVVRSTATFNVIEMPYKNLLGFFKRVRPPQDDCTEKEQLQPEENGNADA
ncbi:Integrin alpha-V, partial [Larimichthys crocea]